jgi:hypothetical protein
MDANTKELFDELREILDNYADINRHGGPNDAMRGMGILADLRDRYEATLQAMEANEAQWSDIESKGW